MRPPILKDFPESFETERLLIRAPRPGDGPEKHAAVNESFDELLPWMDWPKEHKTVEDSEERIRRDRIRFLERSDLLLLFFLKGTNTLVGSSGLHRMDWSVPRFEIGYWVRSSFAGRGYATEAVRAIGAFAFKHLGARRVEIRCDSLNHRSVKVAERAGFRLEGELRNAEVGTDGEPRNVLVFSMIPEEYEAARSKSLMHPTP
ncbi:MAG: GNAT family N-acetyltransferase [Actinomycetota bacterium]|nr:GNAT family N-acetyltransferase [Actinomycetota bacterium]